MWEELLIVTLLSTALVLGNGEKDNRDVWLEVRCAGPTPSGMKNNALETYMADKLPESLSFSGTCKRPDTRKMQGGMCIFEFAEDGRSRLQQIQASSSLFQICSLGVGHTVVDSRTCFAKRQQGKLVLVVSDEELPTPGEETKAVTFSVVVNTLKMDYSCTANAKAMYVVPRAVPAS